MKVIFFIALTCGPLARAIPSDTQMESQLTRLYQDKVLALRHSFKSNSQEYAADGTPARTSDEGPWTLYGRIVVNKVAVDPDKLKVEGKRAIFFFDKSGNLTQFREDRKHPSEKLKITLRLRQPLTTADEAAEVLGRVFTLTPEDTLNLLPSYWQAYLAPKLIDQPTKDDAQDAGKDQRESPNKSQVGDKSGGEEVLKLGDKSVTAPRVLQAPEPEFTDAARSRRFQGVVGLNVVIDSTGTVRNIRIKHPLGMGLDDNAVATVSRWRFAPGKKDGRPVAVAVYIEVDFHLY